MAGSPPGPAGAVGGEGGGGNAGSLLPRVPAGGVVAFSFPSVARRALLAFLGPGGRTWALTGQPGPMLGGYGPIPRINACRSWWFGTVRLLELERESRCPKRSDWTKPSSHDTLAETIRLSELEPVIQRIHIASSFRILDVKVVRNVATCESAGLGKRCRKRLVMAKSEDITFEVSVKVVRNDPPRGISTCHSRY